VAREARRLGVIETRSLEEELILRLSERWYALAAKVFAVVQNTFEIHAFLATPRHGSHAIEGTATEGPRAVSPENARELLRQQPRFGRDDHFLAEWLSSRILSKINSPILGCTPSGSVI